MKRTLRLLLAPLLLSSPVPPRARRTGTPPGGLGRRTPSPSGRRPSPRPSSVPGRCRTAASSSSFATRRAPSANGWQKLVYPSAVFPRLHEGQGPRQPRPRLDPTAQRLAERFGVRAGPAWLVLTPDLLLAGKQEGESNQSTWIERFVASERAWAVFRQKLDQEKTAPADLGASFAVGEEAYRRYGDAMAEERFRRVADDPKAPADLRERSLAYLASIALEARRFDDAEKALKKILATTKDPVLREKAELRLADVDIGRGDRTKAADRLEGLPREAPRIPSAARGRGAPQGPRRREAVKDPEMTPRILRRLAATLRSSRSPPRPCRRRTRRPVRRLAPSRVGLREARRGPALPARRRRHDRAGMARQLEQAPRGLPHPDRSGRRAGRRACRSAAPAYPAHREKKLPFSEKPLALFDGETVIVVEGTAAADAVPGPRTLRRHPRFPALQRRPVPRPGPGRGDARDRGRAGRDGRHPGKRRALPARRGPRRQRHRPGGRGNRARPRRPTPVPSPAAPSPPSSASSSSRASPST